MKLTAREQGLVLDGLDRSEWAGRRLGTLLSDLSVLLKLRIAAMVGFAALVGALVAGRPDATLARAVEAALWVVCVAGASTVFNQVLERETDGLMHRTRNRPLPTGRVKVRDAILLGAALAIVGTVALALRFNVLSSLLALATLVAYALVYTPLKRVSTLNTVVGALPGAMPPVLGFAAMTGGVHGWAWMLFASLFAWQFPHFMAIAWLHRADYARGGMCMLPSVEGAEGMAGRQALLYALVLLPISLLPSVRGDAGAAYAVCALLLGLMYACTAGLFALRESTTRARLLLFVSLAYLPALFTSVLIDPVVRATCAQTLP